MDMATHVGCTAEHLAFHNLTQDVGKVSKPFATALAHLVLSVALSVAARAGGKVWRRLQPAHTLLPDADDGRVCGSCVWTATGIRARTLVA